MKTCPKPVPYFRDRFFYMYITKIYMNIYNKKNLSPIPPSKNRNPIGTGCRRQVLKNGLKWLNHGG
jgi:hypothetical protein